MKRPIGDVNGPLGRAQTSAAFTFVDTDEGITGVSLAGNGAGKGLEHRSAGGGPRGGGGRGACIGGGAWALGALKEKIRGEPLWRTFGAREGRCKAYASGIDLN